MMKATDKFVCLAGVLTLLAAGPAHAIDTSTPFLCATIQVHECIDGSACESVLPEDVNAPTFMRIDVKAKEIRVTLGSLTVPAGRFRSKTIPADL